MNAFSLENRGDCDPMMGDMDDTKKKVTHQYFGLAVIPMKFLCCILKYK